MNDNWAVKTCIEGGHREAVKILVSYEIDAHVALMHAISHRQTHIVEMLLGLGEFSERFPEVFSGKELERIIPRIFKEFSVKYNRIFSKKYSLILEWLITCQDYFFDFAAGKINSFSHEFLVKFRWNFEEWYLW